jgi:hypothetical protein
MADPQLVTNPDLASQIATLQVAATQISEFLSRGAAGAMTAHVLEVLKNAGWFTSLTQRSSTRAKMLWGAAGSLLASLGITATFQHGATPGVYTILLTGLTGASLASHAWGFAQSWVFSQGWYSAVVKPRAVTGVPPSAPAANPVVVSP